MTKEMRTDKPDRAVLFIDGNNWYHALKETGVTRPMSLSYCKISRKLSTPREWIGTRYYIGALKQTRNPRMYADQRRFLAQFAGEDPSRMSYFSAHSNRACSSYITLDRTWFADCYF